VVALCERPAEQLGSLVVVVATHEDGVDLDRSQPGRAGRLEPGEHVLEPVAAGDGVEGLLADAVEADVDPVEPGRCERLGHPGQPKGVGRQRRLDAELVATSDDVHQATAYEWLPAGEPDLADPELLDADPDKSDDLVVGEHGVVGQPVEALRRHAVAAAQVAPVGQRDPQVRRHPTEAILEALCRHHHSLVASPEADPERRLGAD
jgi:hypothetical protein